MARRVDGIKFTDPSIQFSKNNFNFVCADVDEVMSKLRYVKACHGLVSSADYELYVLKRETGFLLTFPHL